MDDVEIPQYEVVERHATTDGLLSFVVLRYQDGDTLLGFEGGPSHVHADMLPGSLAGLPKSKSIRRYVDDLTESRSVIAVERIDGKIADAWVVDEYVLSRMRPLPDRPVELRRWDGTAWEAPPTTQRSASNSESE